MSKPDKISEADRIAMDLIAVEQDTEYAANMETGKWPSDDCADCKKQEACCKRDWHHHGSCCTHCGNDERDPSKWKFRGK